MSVDRNVDTILYGLMETNKLEDHSKEKYGYQCNPYGESLKDW